MKANRFLLPSLVLSALFFFSCKKNDHPDQPDKEKKVYVLCNEQLSSASRSVTRSYVDGVVTATLGDGQTTDNYGVDMDISGNDIYILNYEQLVSTGAREYVLYKNGIAIDTILPTAGFIPYCMAVSGNDIYMGGNGVNSSNGKLLKLWKNGVITDISTPAPSNWENAPCWDIAVKGTDVYLAGFQFNYTTIEQKATYWKNGVEVTLSTGDDEASSGQAHRIFVVGNDVYVAGYIGDRPCFWKNGELNLLSVSEGYCYGIAVSGSDVYASGGVQSNSGDYIPVYWKNGEMEELPTSSSQGGSYGIAVEGNDVYVSGYGFNASGAHQAVYWKNDEARLLGSTSNYGYGYRILVR